MRDKPESEVSEIGTMESERGSTNVDLAMTLEQRGLPDEVVEALLLLDRYNRERDERDNERLRQLAQQLERALHDGKYTGRVKETVQNFLSSFHRGMSERRRGRGESMASIYDAGRSGSGAAGFYADAFSTSSPRRQRSVSFAATDTLLESPAGSVEETGAEREVPPHIFAEIDLHRREQAFEEEYGFFNMNRDTRSYYSDPEIKRQLMDAKRKSPQKKFWQLTKQLGLMPSKTRRKGRTVARRSKGSPQALAFTKRLLDAGLDADDFEGRTAATKKRLLEEAIASRSGLTAGQTKKIMKLQKDLDPKTRKMFNQALGENGGGWDRLMEQIPGGQKTFYATLTKKMTASTKNKIIRELLSKMSRTEVSPRTAVFATGLPHPKYQKIHEISDSIGGRPVEELWDQVLGREGDRWTKLQTTMQGSERTFYDAITNYGREPLSESALHAVLKKIQHQGVGHISGGSFTAGSLPDVPSGLGMLMGQSNFQSRGD